MARDYCPFAMVAGIERFDATGGASSLPYEKRTGYCGFGRVGCGARVGVAIPPVVARIFSGDSTSPLTREARTWCGARDSADTKPYKHTQTLALRKVGGIVRFWKGWWSDNPSVLTAEKFAA